MDPISFKYTNAPFPSRAAGRFTAEPLAADAHRGEIHLRLSAAAAVAVALLAQLSGLRELARLDLQPPSASKPPEPPAEHVHRACRSGRGAGVVEGRRD
jgi:hypothetical protein